MGPYRIEIGPSVTFRLNSLLQPEQEQVMSDIDRLRANPFPPDAPNVYPVEGAPGKTVFVLRTLDRLRVLYTVESDGTILVKNIANQDLADRYFRTPSTPAAVG